MGSQNTAMSIYATEYRTTKEVQTSQKSPVTTNTYFNDMFIKQ